MDNRRNYYRILHVQPGAPTEIIRASYRTLMQRLRAHPDLGGDHWNATIINEAYSVLSDPLKRARYDQEFHTHIEQMRGETTAYTLPERETHSGAIQRCLFCHAPNRVQPRRAGGLLCVNCASPLQRKAAPQHVAAEQRAIERLARRQSVKLYSSWPQPFAQRAQCRDVSPEGISFVSSTALSPGAVLKLESPLCAAVIEVVHVRRAPKGEAGDWLIGARFLSVAFTRRRGGFLTESV